MLPVKEKIGLQYNLIIKDFSHDSNPENNIWIMSFECDFQSAQEAENAVRLAVKDYLETAEGKEEYINNHHNFNWGDVMVHVPPNIFKLRDLKIKQLSSIESIVSHDEELGDFLEESEDT